MARIPAPKHVRERERKAAQKPPRRRPVLPSWIPLMVAVAGFGLVLGPDDVTWPLRVAGAAMLAGGSFWLGSTQTRDPADTSRIQQLEAALLRVALRDRDVSLRRDVAQALGTERSRAPAAPAEPQPDGLDDRGGSGDGHLRAVPDGAEPDLDAPLPGESR